MQTLRARTPEGMHKLLMEKKFTNGADREVVVKLYTNVAERCIYPAEMLDYDGFSFGDEEMKVLCEWWPKCEVVEKLFPAEQRVHRDGLGPAGGGGGAEGRDAKAEVDIRPTQQGQALRQAQGGVRERGSGCLVDEGTVGAVSQQRASKHLVPCV